MKLEGLDELQNKLKNIAKVSEQKVADIVKANAVEMSADAKRRAPQVYKYNGGGEQPTNGEINQSIATTQDSKLKWMVSVNSKMGAYAEFGTGAFVDVPAGWEDIAWSYYVNGKGLMLPTPYFYPAYRETQKRFLNDIKNYLNTLEESR